LGGMISGGRFSGGILIFFTDAHLRFGAFLDAIQLVGPIALECSGPLMQGLDRLGVGAVELVAAIAARLDEADVAQHAEVFGHRRLIESQDGHDLAHRKLFHDKQGKNLPAPRLSHRVENIGSGCSARHEKEATFPYGNMSSVIWSRG